jgi:hypothetical protein
MLAPIRTHTRQTQRQAAPCDLEGRRGRDRKRDCVAGRSRRWIIIVLKPIRRHRPHVQPNSGTEPGTGKYGEPKVVYNRRLGIGEGRTGVVVANETLPVEIMLPDAIPKVPPVKVPAKRRNALIMVSPVVPMRGVRTETLGRAVSCDGGRRQVLADV